MRNKVLVRAGVAVATVVPGGCGSARRVIQPQQRPAATGECWDNGCDRIGPPLEGTYAVRKNLLIS